MSKPKKIALEKLLAVQKRIRAMPVKDNSKEPGEALEMLAEDVRNMLEKGYSLKEVRGIFIEEDVPLTTFMLRRHLEIVPRKKASRLQNIAPVASQKLACDTEKTLLVADEKLSPGNTKNSPSDGEKTGPKATKKVTPAYEGIIVKPDTPDTEL